MAAHALGHGVSTLATPSRGKGAFLADGRGTTSFLAALVTGATLLHRSMRASRDDHTTIADRVAKVSHRKACPTGSSRHRSPGAWLLVTEMLGAGLNAA